MTTEIELKEQIEALEEFIDAFLEPYNEMDIGPSPVTKLRIQKIEAAIETLEGLRWTTEKPTKAGWYWWRDPILSVVPEEMVFINRQMDMRRMELMFETEQYDFADTGGEWSGPIPLPLPPSD